MRMNEHANKLETNVTGNETRNFGIGDASVIIEILRNRLYEHKIQTLVQEYVCNARDAMREVGKGNQFDITIPTHLSPVFKVRDYGPGITPDRMEKVFVLYGASTKRGTNGQTGGFGIGAKSAWAYTDSFTIVTHVDGTKRTYIAHTGVNNNGRLDLVSTAKTDEPNGTEIQVPVGKYELNEFRDAVFRAIYFWDERPNLKGEVDTLDRTRGIQVNDNIEVVNGDALPSYIGLNRYNHNTLAVIDGVPYPITDKLLEKCRKLREVRNYSRNNVIMYFGNGIVEVSASRESIADSKQSIDALEKLATKAILALKTYLTERFAKVNSTVEYFTTYRELSPHFYTDNFAKYGEYEISGGLVKNDLFNKIKITHIHNLNSRKRYKVEKITKEEVADNKKSIEIDKIKNLFFAKTTDTLIRNNKRIREYLKTESWIVLIESKGDDAALDQVIADLGAQDFMALTWTEEPKQPKVKVEREKESFCAHTVGNRYDRHQYMTLEENDKKWLYVQMVDGGYGGWDANQLKELCQYIRPEGLQICGLATKVVSHVEGNENFSKLADWLADFKPNKKQMAYVKKVNAVNREEMKLISRLKGLDDEILSDMANEYKAMDKSETQPIPGILMEIVRKTDEYKEFEKKDKELEKQIKKYPLLVDLSSWIKADDDVVIYLNAKFKTLNK